MVGGGMGGVMVFLEGGDERVFLGFGMESQRAWNV